MLRQDQHDNAGLFCHSKEQSDEESGLPQAAPIINTVFPLNSSSLMTGCLSYEPYTKVIDAPR
ncbi:MAG: hypothetical protein HOF21_08775 [Nitrospina sp.]|jgi:hypothetical protein|nr:hypothetical protein [Nitrospina sp.]